MLILARNVYTRQAVTEDASHRLHVYTQVHGYTMMLSWLVLVPICILVVRTGNRWNLWLPVHVATASLSIVLIVVGSGFGFAASHGQHIRTTHQRLGLCLLAALLLETALGVTISVLWRPNRIKTPVLDKLHWWWGRALALFAFLVLAYGYMAAQWGVWAYVLTLVVWCCLIVLYSLQLLFT